MEELDPVKRAGLAGEITNNPVWEEAFEELERVYVGIIKALPATDNEALFRYKQALVSVDFIKSHFETAMLQGKLAIEEAELAESSNVERLPVRKF